MKRKSSADKKHLKVCRLKERLLRRLLGAKHNCTMLFISGADITDITVSKEEADDNAK